MLEETFSKETEKDIVSCMNTDMHCKPLNTRQLALLALSLPEYSQPRAQLWRGRYKFRLDNNYLLFSAIKEGAVLSMKPK